MLISSPIRSLKIQNLRKTSRKIIMKQGYKSDILMPRNASDRVSEKLDFENFLGSMPPELDFENFAFFGKF